MSRSLSLGVSSPGAYLASLRVRLHSGDLSSILATVARYPVCFPTQDLAASAIYPLIASDFTGPPSALPSLLHGLAQAHFPPSYDFLSSTEQSSLLPLPLPSFPKRHAIVNWWAEHGWHLYPPLDPRDIEPLVQSLLLPFNLASAPLFSAFLDQVDRSPPVYRQAVSDHLWMALLLVPSAVPTVNAILGSALRHGYDLPPRTRTFPFDSHKNAELSYLTFCFLDDNSALRDVFLTIPERRADFLTDLRRYAPYLLNYESRGSFLPYLVEAGVNLFAPSADGSTVLHQIFAADRIDLPPDLAAYLESHASQVMTCVDKSGRSCFSDPSSQAIVSGPGLPSMSLPAYHSYLKKLVLDREIPPSSSPSVPARRM